MENAELLEDLFKVTDETRERVSEYTEERLKELEEQARKTLTSS